jgi:iron complex outermembrane receptor protein
VIKALRLRASRAKKALATSHGLRPAAKPVAGFCVTFAVSIALLIPTPASAQNGSVSGRVTDPDRAVVTEAEVTLTHIDTGAQRIVRSAADGTFRFIDLVPGRYLLQIMKPGFGMYSEDFTVTPTGYTIEASLQIAGVTEDVTVRGIATNPSIGRTAVPLKDQPITVNRVTAEQLKQQGINDLVTAMQFVNNVNAYQQYGVYEHYQFRGFSDVVQMVDGIRNEGNRVRSQLSNVESIEVLKGPASVLYGSDSLGATMNIVLKKPSPQPSYDGSVSAGSWNTYRGTFGATGASAWIACSIASTPAPSRPTTFAATRGTGSTSRPR